jgi:predicted MFS family arabinose efflux permease
MKRDSRAALRSHLLVFTIARTILNTGFRLIYPFISTFARALGVEVDAVALAVTARSALGLSGPLLGNLGDSIGRKFAMIFGLLLFTAGFALVLFVPTYPSLFAALLLGAAGKIIFDPAMQAYLGDQVVYDRRSTAIAITEMGWSGASLLGLPLVGWLIARQGWIAPFPTLALLMLASVFLLWRVLPPDEKPDTKSPSIRSAWLTILNTPSAIAALSITLLSSIGNEAVNIVYGLWLEGSFGLQVVALGAASSVIGFAELSGEGVVALVTDRMGKKRAIATGLLLTAGACLALPILGRNLIGVLFGLFLFYISFEFTFVSLIALVTELMPTARATLMAGNLAAAAGGRAIGALAGPWLFSFGIFWNASFGALLTLVAAAVLWRWVKVE